MDDLVAFVRARLDEDEWIAQGADRYPPNGSTSWTPAALQTTWDARVDDHVARHNPARALREVAHKRRIVEDHQPRPLVDPDDRERPDWPERECRRCGGSWMGTPDWAKDEDVAPPEPVYCEDLRHLAAVYSAHPDYRAEWAA